MQELFPLAEYRAGAHTSAAVPLPAGATAYRLSVARCTAAAPDVWPGAEQTIEAQVELLVDGDWLAWGAFKAYGGRHVRREGGVGDTSYLIANCSGAPAGALLRVTLTPSHALRTRAWIEFE